jgi:hypothetical protein
LNWVEREISVKKVKTSIFQKKKIVVVTPTGVPNKKLSGVKAKTQNKISIVPYNFPRRGQRVNVNYIKLKIHFLFFLLKFDALPNSEIRIRLQQLNWKQRQIY